MAKTLCSKFRKADVENKIPHTHVHMLQLKILHVPTKIKDSACPNQNQRPCMLQLRPGTVNKIFFFKEEILDS